MMEKVIARNKKALHDFEILETYEAGILLKGSEVKSIRERKISLKDSFAKIENGELFLYHVNISSYQPSSPFSLHPERKRKLLLKKAEIHRLEGKLYSGGVIVPLSVYFKKGLVKVEIAVARALKKYEKREKIRKKEIKREIASQLKRRQ